MKRSTLDDFCGPHSPCREFWRDAVALKGSVTPFVMPNVLLLGFFAVVVCVASDWAKAVFGFRLALPIAPYEVFGAVMGVLLVLRTNAGYERWWEGRKLWGGIVNQCRNLAVDAVSYGPHDAQWRNSILRWIAVYAHVTRLTLRNQKPDEKVRKLVGDAETSKLANVDHMPTYVARRISQLLRQAVEANRMQVMAFHQADRERSILIDHMGACERILKTPLAPAYSIKIRRFLALCLLLLPVALIEVVGNNYLVPLATMVISYPLLSLDQLGVELQEPFSTTNLSHLPLDEICDTIERNVMSLAEDEPDSSFDAATKEPDRRLDTQPVQFFDERVPQQASE